MKMIDHKVYSMRMIYGKSTNYDANGKLKNKTVTAKFTGEKEIEDLLRDDNYKSLGICEIECVQICDSRTGKQMFEDRKDEINKRIKDNQPKKVISKVDKLEAELAELKAMLANQGKTNTKREVLEKEANELNIKYRSDISDEKLIEKINNAKA